MGGLIVVAMLAALLDKPASYVAKGWFLISVPNLVVMILMAGVLILAVVLPFPKGKRP